MTSRFRFKVPMKDTMPRLESSIYLISPHLLSKENLLGLPGGMALKKNKWCMLPTSPTGQRQDLFQVRVLWRRKACMPGRERFGIVGYTSLTETTRESHLS